MSKKKYLLLIIPLIFLSGCIQPQEKNECLEHHGLCRETCLSIERESRYGCDYGVCCLIDTRCHAEGHHECECRLSHGQIKLIDDCCDRYMFLKHVEEGGEFENLTIESVFYSYECLINCPDPNSVEGCEVTTCKKELDKPWDVAIYPDESFKGIGVENNNYEESREVKISFDAYCGWLI